MMQETELRQMLSSLDRIAPPSGTRERLLKEKILTKSEMPVNDSQSETSVFSIIEDKRSDIIPPETVSEELPEEKEKKYMGTSPDAKGETALFKQPKFLLGFGIAAACIAVIAIGALAISIFTGKSKLDTSPADSGNKITDKIMSAGESIYSKLDTYKEFPYKESDEGEITDERKEFKKEDIGNAAKCYRLANGYYLLLADKEEFGAVLLDNEKNIIAQNIAWNGSLSTKYITSSERYIFTGQLESSENQPNSHLTIGIADIDSPDALSEEMWYNDGFASININDYAEGGQICSYKVVPYDMSVHKENPDDPESIDIASCYFAANYTNAEGAPEGAVYRADSGHGRAELIYTLKNKKEGDEVKRLEGVYAPESLNDLTNIYAVYSKSTKETNSIGLYEKEYYVVAIDPKGKSEPVETKLFDAADDPYALTFERDYTAICSTNVFGISFLNKNTGLITIVQDYSIIMKDGANMDGTTDRYLKLDVNRSLMTAPTYRYLSYSRFAACETVSSSFRQIMYTDENGRLETVNDYSEVPDNAIKIDSTEYICNRSAFFTRIDYGEDGKPISTLIVVSEFGDTIDFDYSCSIEGAAISAENGKAIFDIDFDSGTSEQELKVHTPDAAYKKTLHS